MNKTKAFWVLGGGVFVGIVLTIRMSMWFAQTITSTTDPMAAAITVTTLALAAGVINSLWSTFRVSRTVAADPSCDVSTMEEKRRVSFDGALAGVTLAAYVAIFLHTGNMKHIRDHMPVMLAILPGAIGFLHHIFSVGKHFALRQSTVDAYKRFRERYDMARRGDTKASPLNELAGDQTLDYTPQLGQTFFAAAVMTAVFMIPAAFYGWNAPKTDIAIDAMTARGIVYAGIGAYVWTLYLVVSRINTAALTARFLTNTAVRSAMGIVLGAVVGKLGAAFLSSKQPTDVDGAWVFFLVGLLPQWALTTLRRKAGEWFGAKEDGCDTLPVCLVDGLDDGLIDRLNELGVGDVQHLATADPGELTLQTLFPLTRVADWVDQAILVQEVRGNILPFRKAGIRTATDLAKLYGEFAGLVELPYNADGGQQDYDARAEAKQRFDTLAQTSSMSAAALHGLGAKLYDDYFVRFLWNLWNMPGSIWTGWLAEAAEWIPAVFEAAKAAGAAVDTAHGWDGAIPADLLGSDAFKKQLAAYLSRAGYKQTGDLPADKTRWRDFIWALAPQIERTPPPLHPVKPSGSEAPQPVLQPQPGT